MFCPSQGRQADKPSTLLNQHCFKLLFLRKNYYGFAKSIDPFSISHTLHFIPDLDFVRVIVLSEIYKARFQKQAYFIVLNY